MAGEIQATWVTAKTLYAVIRNATGAVWNGSSFVSYTTGNLGTYAVTMTEQGTASGYYAGTFPVVAEGAYSVAVYERAGGSPAEGDTLAAYGSVEWDGIQVRCAGDANVSSVDGDEDAAAGLKAAGNAYNDNGWFRADVEAILNDTANVANFSNSYATGALTTTVPAGVWASVTRTLSALDEDSTTLDLDATIRAAVGLGSANLDTQLDALPTAAENAAALMDLSNGVETGLTPRQAMRLFAAALAGKLSGAGTTTIVIRNAVADSKARITATVDDDGNRSAITYDVT